MPDRLVNDLVALSNFIVNPDFFVVYSNFADNDSLSVVAGTKGLELKLEDFKKLLAYPPPLGKRFELMWVLTYES